MYLDKNDGHCDGTFTTSLENFIASIIIEKEQLPVDFPLCAAVIEEALDRIYETGRKPGKEFKADVFHQKPLRIRQSVYLPINDYPELYFQKLLLDHRGDKLRQLLSGIQCEIAVKGRLSMTNSTEEEALRLSGDRRYKHLNKKLYLEITTMAAPAEAYTRMANALRVIRKYLCKLHVLQNISKEDHQDSEEEYED